MIPTTLIFDAERVTMIANIASPMIEIKNTSLIRKKEFHFTILGYQTGIKILDHIASYTLADQQAIISEIDNLCQTYQRNIRLESGYYHIEKTYEHDTPLSEDYTETTEHRSSIIQTIQVPDLEPYYAQLDKLLDIQLTIPYPHVTIYTNSSRPENSTRGIGIYSNAEFDLLKKQHILLPEA